MMQYHVVKIEPSKRSIICSTRNRMSVFNLLRTIVRKYYKQGYYITQTDNITFRLDKVDPQGNMSYDSLITVEEVA